MLLNEAAMESTIIRGAQKPSRWTHRSPVMNPESE